MPGRYLLDANAVIALFAHEAELEALLHSAEAVFLSTIVLGELFFGAQRSSRVQDNVERLERFAAENTVLSANFEVAKFYGLIKHELKSKGRPIPENDVWIAATAMRHGLKILSRDRHFESVSGIESVSW